MASFFDFIPVSAKTPLRLFPTRDNLSQVESNNERTNRKTHRMDATRFERMQAAQRRSLIRRWYREGYLISYIANRTGATRGEILGCLNGIPIRNRRTRKGAINGK